MAELYRAHLLSRRDMSISVAILFAGEEAVSLIPKQVTSVKVLVAASETVRVQVVEAIRFDEQVLGTPTKASTGPRTAAAAEAATRASFMFLATRMVVSEHGVQPARARSALHRSNYVIQHYV